MALSRGASISIYILESDVLPMCHEITGKSLPMYILKDTPATVQKNIMAGESAGAGKAARRLQEQQPQKAAMPHVLQKDGGKEKNICKKNPEKHTQKKQSSTQLSQDRFLEVTLTPVTLSPIIQSVSKSCLPPQKTLNPINSSTISNSTFLSLQLHHLCMTMPGASTLVPQISFHNSNLPA